MWLVLVAHRCGVREACVCEMCFDFRWALGLSTVYNSITYYSQYTWSWMDKHGRRAHNHKLDKVKLNLKDMRCIDDFD